MYSSGKDIEEALERMVCVLNRIADTQDQILAAVQANSVPGGSQTLGQTLISLTEGVNQLMSQITDFAAKVETSFASVKAGIKALNDKITAFQNSPGTLSPSDQAALDQIQADSAALANAANAVVPPVPAT